MKSSATVVNAPVMETAVLAAHIAPPRRAAAATAQAISEAQQVCPIIRRLALMCQNLPFPNY